MKKKIPHMHFNALNNSMYVFVLFLLIQTQSLFAQTFPTNFAGVQIATGLDPVAMDIAPDGRIFLAEKNGKIRIIKNGSLLPTPFITIPNLDNFNERGLLKVLIDPDFATNHYVYTYYTYKSPATNVSNNRVSRFTANGDVAVAGSELVLINLNDLGSVGYHNGGGLAFKDGKIFISTGENTVSSNSQSFNTLLGKVLRINSDGSIPTDNPFYTSATGNNRAIWALGFRNPFKLAVQPGTGRLFINDVGAGTWEEINDGLAGKNYGWPEIEGVRTNQTMPANYQDPFYAYNHNAGGCAITAGAFYNPAVAQFPSAYTGNYFFGDYCDGNIKTLDLSTKAVTTFASGINRPLDMVIGNDGTLYFIARGGIPGGSDDANTSSTNGVVWKVNYTGSGVPVVAVQPADKTVSAGQSVTFTVVASGNPAPTYQWLRDGVSISGATSASYTIASTVLADNNAKFSVRLQNTVGTVTSNQATLTVLNNQLPTATITSPAIGATYSGGDVITFTATGTDAEDGTLPASAFTWKIDLYHFDTPSHSHPAMEPVSGIKSGTFTIPTQMETSANVLFRIFLTVVDASGATYTTSRDIIPVTSTITLATNPSGLSVKLDGASVAAPYSFVGVRGILREISTTSPQVLNGVTYTFSSWSDGGSITHTISTPAANTTLTANFVQSSCAPTAIVPYAQVNAGAWQNSSSVSLAAGASFKLGPQPVTGGTWRWSGPGGFTATTREISRTAVTPAMAGGYVATYTNACGAISTLTFNITVTTSGCNATAIVPYVQINGGAWQSTSSASVAAGGSFKFGPQPVSGGTWRWSGPNEFTATAREISRTGLTAAMSGAYIATYMNTCGTTSTVTFNITVTQTTTPLVTAAEPVTEENQLILLPNPVEDQLFISDTAAVIRIEIYDMQGMKIISVEHPEHTLSVTSLPSGLYIAFIHKQHNVLVKQKIIKK
ncbi:PQQ-dependent sugar dehydrogenase [Cytophaga aurantiaca]|uniref:PQQ-dependent sugar dehydrogenase n=1 Tax=Cytophaga aurantiaca TaxID=29530 RepID=UPI000379D6C2|nr:PQQ-dependent sugar dehydrogenase [Cytophaga aurantiaca]